ncbi:cytochrome b/b6 domain-containing protein [Salinibacterium sp. ZJ77]|uniref:cytochrome b/b6 domain-containing protein n=1 Tax=Salinibacterium sp. ZJ77 TaxID=2708337 RepID=UPI0014206BAA|nr:cytochrome b/b6 domain-containing protein [Salinibacterium sp. ZJ77]
MTNDRTPDRGEAAAPAAHVKRRRGIRWAVGGAALLVFAIIVVAIARWLRTLDPVIEFLAAYPGSYPLPENAPVGLPAWLGWQHFFNIFLLVLIVRTGWEIRRTKTPKALWSSRKVRKRRMSLTVWFHQGLDVLWVANGVIYVVLLFATGQWMRIVPTSWDVFPNAISALLQYASFDWPTENSWVNYNSAQQLAYFVTVFVAAPLAIASGARMSAWWPREGRLAKVPYAWAEKLHFPVMIYFVAFVIVHVLLVLTTGVLRNLNHMYASRDDVSWWGFAVFAGSLVVLVAGWLLARTSVIAWIGRRFGDVTIR